MEKVLHYPGHSSVTQKEATTASSEEEQPEEAENELLPEHPEWGNTTNMQGFAQCHPSWTLVSSNVKQYAVLSHVLCLNSFSSNKTPLPTQLNSVIYLRQAKTLRAYHWENIRPC